MQDFSSYQLENVDLELFQRFNVFPSILQKALQSAGVVQVHFQTTAAPVMQYGCYQIYQRGNNFFVQKLQNNEVIDQKMMYFIICAPLFQQPDKGDYPLVFSVDQAIQLPNRALPAQKSNYDISSVFGQILCKTEQQKYAELVIACDQQLISLRVSLQYSKLFDQFKGGKVKIFQQNGKFYALIPIIYAGELVDGVQAQNLRIDMDCMINDSDTSGQTFDVPEAVEFNETLQESQVGNLALSSRFALSSNTSAKLVGSTRKFEYFCLYMVNSKLQASYYGHFTSNLGKQTQVQYHDGKINFLDEQYKNCLINFEDFLTEYARFKGIQDNEQSDVDAIQNDQTFEISLEQQFKYYKSPTCIFTNFKIIDMIEQGQELMFQAADEEKVPDLVFFQHNEPIFNQMSLSINSLQFTQQSQPSAPTFSMNATNSLTDNQFTFQASQQSQAPKSKVQLSLKSQNLDQELSQFQQQCYIDPKSFMLTDVTGYVRYHFPSYNIAIVAFKDPYNRDDRWIHSIAIWNVPKELQRKIKRHNNTVVPDGTEDIYFARAKIVCNIYPYSSNSGIYMVDSAKFLDYDDPSSKCKRNQLVEGSVYWQEIDKSKSQDNTFGFVRLVSGHERHFFCKQKVQFLGHLVNISLQENKAHPNSCELISSVLPPPDKNTWLLGKIIAVFNQLPSALENILKKSFRTVMSHTGFGRQMVNGMILAEPFQGTHIDICFFRLVLPDIMIQQMKPGKSVYFTLKEQALHKVIDEAKCQIPIDLLNDLINHQTLRQQYRIQQKDLGNSAKLSCWAVDNITLTDEQYTGEFFESSDKNCVGIIPEQRYFDRFKSLLQSQRDSIVYIPRPIIQSEDGSLVLKSGEQLSFNAYFSYNDQKSAFLPEACAIGRLSQNVYLQGIVGRIIKYQAKDSFVYLFRPNSCESVEENILQCISDSIIPLTNCVLIKSSCFYQLQNQVLNYLQESQQQQNAKTVFFELLNGNIDVTLNIISLGLVYTKRITDDFNLKQIEWVRQADELIIKTQTLDKLNFAQSKEDIIEEDQFIKY